MKLLFQRQDLRARRRLLKSSPMVVEEGRLKGKIKQVENDTGLCDNTDSTRPHHPDCLDRKAVKLCYPILRFESKLRITCVVVPIQLDHATQI